MKIIKLDTIDSTNTFLKQLDKNVQVDNLTAVWTPCQTSGRGQRHSKWVSDKNKNLTFSVLMRIDAKNILPIHGMSIACLVVETLRGLGFTDVMLKWPNDILWKSKKIGGILIENRLSAQEVVSIVGIGINVFQEHFEQLPQASSLYLLSKTLSINSQIELLERLTLERLMMHILQSLKDSYVYSYTQQQQVDIQQRYHKYLFGYKALCHFQLMSTNAYFSAVIDFVDIHGNIHLKNDESEQVFSLKEIKMLY